MNSSPLDSFVFADLLERTYKLADLEQHERVAIDLNHEREKRFPTTFRGVGVGYERLGRSCLCRGALAEAKVRFQKAQIAFVVEGDGKGAAAQFLNFARVGCAAGDGANAREYLDRVRSSFAVDGYDFDVEARPPRTGRRWVSVAALGVCHCKVADVAYHRLGAGAPESRSTPTAGRASMIAL